MAENAGCNLYPPGSLDWLKFVQQKNYQDIEVELLRL